MDKIDNLIRQYAKKSPKEAQNLYNQQQAFSAAVAIVKLQHQLGLSQRQFSKLIDVPHSTVSRIENGDMNPSSKLLGKIAVKTHKHLKIQFV